MGNPARFIKKRSDATYQQVEEIKRKRVEQGM
jgi:hypothetical protein